MINNKRNLNGGYVGLLALLIVISIIIFFIVRTDLFTGQKGSKTILEQSTDSINKAKDAKTQIELHTSNSLEGE